MNNQQQCDALHELIASIEESQESNSTNVQQLAIARLKQGGILLKKHGLKIAQHPVTEEAAFVKEPEVEEETVIPEPEPTVVIVSNLNASKETPQAIVAEDNVDKAIHADLTSMPTEEEAADANVEMAAGESNTDAQPEPKFGTDEYEGDPEKKETADEALEKNETPVTEEQVESFSEAVETLNDDKSEGDTLTDEEPSTVSGSLE